MTPEELKSILIEGAELTAFKVDDETAKRIVAETQAMQEKILAQKEINYELLNQRITI
jgi:hypothetical protein